MINVFDIKVHLNIDRFFNAIKKISLGKQTSFEFARFHEVDLYFAHIGYTYRYFFPSFSTRWSCQNDAFILRRLILDKVQLELIEVIIFGVCQELNSGPHFSQLRFNYGSSLEK